jgi:hypothetical protein
MDTTGASTVVALWICKYYHLEEDLRRQMELMQLLGELVAPGVEIISAMAGSMNDGRYCAAYAIVCSHTQKTPCIYISLHSNFALTFT